LEPSVKRHGAWSRRWANSAWRRPKLSLAGRRSCYLAPSAAIHKDGEAPPLAKETRSCSNFRTRHCSRDCRRDDAAVQCRQSSAGLTIATRGDRVLARGRPAILHIAAGAGPRRGRGTDGDSGLCRARAARPGSKSATRITVTQIDRPRPVAPAAGAARLVVPVRHAVSRHHDILDFKLPHARLEWVAAELKKRLTVPLRDRR